MKSIAGLLKFFEVLYKSLFVFLGLLLVGLLGISIMYWVVLQNDLTTGNIWKEILDSPGSAQYFNWSFLSGISFHVFLITINFGLHALIFQKLARFFKLQNQRAALNLQRDALNKLPGYLMALYGIGLSQIAIPMPTTAPSAETGRISDLLNQFLPGFDGPVALVIAAVIVIYRRSLLEQEAVTAEAHRLQQEAELVI